MLNPASEGLGDRFGLLQLVIPQRHDDDFRSSSQRGLEGDEPEKVRQHQEAGQYLRVDVGHHILNPRRLDEEAHRPALHGVEMGDACATHS